jgi:HD-like signal output (HDOD) protein
MNDTQPKPTPPSGAFEFVRTLAGELSTGKVYLPSFPDVTVRVRRVLSNPDSTIEQVIRVVGSEPALAARLMRIANSASFNRSGRSVTDLRAAINRIGYNMVRNAAMSFAMAQIRKCNNLASLSHILKDLWERSTLVAALAFVLARKCTKINADEAMLAGMMHAIGKLFILTRAADHPELFSKDMTLHQIINDWHPSIGKAILENWEFPELMAQAVGEQNNDSRTDVEQGDLCDIVAVAIVMASHVANPDELVIALQGSPAAGRLGLTEVGALGVIRESMVEVTALGEALGD